MTWIVYALVVLGVSIVIGLHLGRFRIAYTEMSGMMLGMAMGMLNGFLLGYAAAAFSSSMFWGNLLGMLLGLGLGIYYGRSGGRSRIIWVFCLTEIGGSEISNSPITKLYFPGFLKSVMN